MFGYYLTLAFRSFRRSKALTVLMALAVALGIGACMTTLTVFYVLSGDPIPGKSDRLFSVQLDPGRMADYQPNEEPTDQLTLFDARALLRDGNGERQAMMTGGKGIIEPEDTSLRPFIANLRYTSADFFPMFDTPFLHGRGWTAVDGARNNRVAVITGALNSKLFEGGANGVGRTIRIDGNSFRIIGVLDRWSPKPHFYDLNTGRYQGEEQVFIPFSTAMDLNLTHEGTISCHGQTVPTDRYAIGAPCTWVQYWVELESSDHASRYRAYLTSYSAQQHAAGRFERPPNARLRNVTEWLDYKNVVPGEVRLQLWLAFGFLLVCLINTVGLLLTKFLRRSGEIGVRRALGASRRAIFGQYLTEAAAIGLAGGVLGLGFATLGLWAARMQPVSYAELVHLNSRMLLLTFVLAVLASVLAGLLPAWRACHVTPAAQLRSQ